jgi:hypothetical protein
MSRSLRRHCPQCQSDRVHHSHRRGLAERLLCTLGADIRRCHTCRARQAWWGAAVIQLGENGGGSGRWSAALVVCTGFVLCVAFVWWLIAHLPS